MIDEALEPFPVPPSSRGRQLLRPAVTAVTAELCDYACTIECSKRHPGVSACAWDTPAEATHIEQPVGSRPPVLTNLAI